MRSALDLAHDARRAGEVPIGAVVVVEDRIVGRGRNATVELCDPTAHAELLALREAAATLGNHRLLGATVFVTVEPCLMCLGAMLHARVGRLVWGAADPKVGATSRLHDLRERGAGFNHRFGTEGGVLAEEAATLLREFFRARRAATPWSLSE